MSIKKIRRKPTGVYLVIPAADAFAVHLATASSGRPREPWLDAAVDEIVDSVLDAADQELLEDVCADWQDPQDGAELLKELTLDIFRRFRERRRSQLTALTLWSRHG